jgi:hypothetical protein
MKTVYFKTKWVDNKTPVNAANLNNIENGLETLFNTSISNAEIIAGDGINIDYNDDKEGLVFGVDSTVQRSLTLKGVEVVCGEQQIYQEDVLYFILSQVDGKLSRIQLNGNIIYAVE